MSYRGKLNTFLIIFCITILSITPLASILLLGMLFYICYKRQWDLFFAWIIIFIVGVAIGAMMLENGSSPNGGAYFLARTLGVIANIIWAVYATLRLRRLYETKNKS